MLNNYFVSDKGNKKKTYLTFHVNNHYRLVSISYIIDLNDEPVIFNLPLAYDITITEGIPPFTWLYTVQHYDINNWNTLTLTATITPAEGATYFEITKTISKLYFKTIK